jgi:hypothetical protein
MYQFMGIIKSRERIRNHGEVFTPDFIVNHMLDLVVNETGRIESRFLEPACGDGNFLIKVLERKMEVIKRRYKKSQFDYERMLVLAVSSIYGIDLLDDNVESARERLHKYCKNQYESLFKGRVNEDVLNTIQYLLSKNILQGDALILKNKDNKLITFSEWSLVNGSKIKRRDFQFVDLAEFDPAKPSLFSVREESDTGEIVFSPQSARDYIAVNFMKLHESYDN